MTDLAAIRERHPTDYFHDPKPLETEPAERRAAWQAREDCRTLLRLLADTPSVEPPTRRDLAETLCFLDHRHDEPSCPKGRHEADRIYRALEARYAHRAGPRETELAEGIRRVKDIERRGYNPPYPGLVMNDPDAGL